MDWLLPSIWGIGEAPGTINILYCIKINPNRLVLWMSGPQWGRGKSGIFLVLVYYLYLEQCPKPLGYCASHPDQLDKAKLLTLVNYKGQYYKLLFSWTTSRPRASFSTATPKTRSSSLPPTSTTQAPTTSTPRPNREFRPTPTGSCTRAKSCPQWPRCTTTASGMLSLQVRVY